MLPSRLKPVYIKEWIFTRVLKMKESSKDFLWLLTGCPVPHPSFINAIFVWLDDPLPCMELFHYLLIFFLHILCLFLLFPSFTLLVFSYPVYLRFLYPIYISYLRMCSSVFISSFSFMFYKKCIGWSDFPLNFIVFYFM